MELNIIGKSNLSQLNLIIKKNKDLLKNGYSILNNLDTKNYSAEINIQTKNTNELRDIKEQLSKNITSANNNIEYLTNLIKAHDKLITAYKTKYAIVMREYNNAVNVSNGRQMAICQKIISAINEEKEYEEKNAVSIIKKLEFLDDFISSAKENLILIEKLLSRYSVFDFDINNIQELDLLEKYKSLRLKEFALKGSEDNELLGYTREYISECKNKLEQLGYKWVNPYKGYKEEVLFHELTNVNNIIMGLTNTSSNIMNNIANIQYAIYKEGVNGVGIRDFSNIEILENKIKELDDCSHVIDNALLYAYDKQESILEVLKGGRVCQR